MKFIYTTDLHGDQNQYNKILSYALEHKIKIINLGADLLPKSPDILKAQKKFVKGFLKGYFSTAAEKGITLLCSFGNDDVYTRKKYFKKYGTLLDEQLFQIDGFVFKSYPFVCDYPFGLKTACKLDYRGWQRPQCSNPVDVTEKGIEHIEDLDQWFHNRTTIEEDLQTITNVSNAIYLCHMPPSDLQLDVCYNKRRVGSNSILEWIKREQPLITLHGHIHESYTMTGVWKQNVGKTLVIQPGQCSYSSSKVRFVEIEIESDITTSLIEI